MRMNFGTHATHAGKPGHKTTRQAEGNSARFHAQKRQSRNNDTATQQLQSPQAPLENGIVDVIEVDPFARPEEENLFGTMAMGSARPTDEAQGGAPLQDDSPALTRRLAAARHLLPIQSVLQDAFKAKSELRMVVATGSRSDAEKAMAIIRRLERVVRRSNRKIRDLDTEARMRRNKESALEDDKIQRAREIERELTRRMRRRREREREWVRDAERASRSCTAGQNQNIPVVSGGIDAATKAKIAAQAAAIAAAEVAFNNMMSGSFGSGDGMSSGGHSGEVSVSVSGGDGAASVDAVV